MSEREGEDMKAKPLFENHLINQVHINKAAEFDGYNIIFAIDHQFFQFLVGSSKAPFPLNIKHIFKEKDTCRQCNKRIMQVPVGQQLCPALQSKKKELLAYFQTHYQNQFTILGNK